MGNKVSDPAVFNRQILFSAQSIFDPFVTHQQDNVNAVARTSQGDRIWIDFCFFAGMARSYACQSFGSTPFFVGAGHACDRIFLIRALNAVTLANRSGRSPK
ncbi:hypothetical protein [Desulfosarcina ovata]|uniref:hypothetical protein n=1 Tax=Desulfosarcina ovata TaxID=83564 RepID=UPI0012D35EA0|nr:hypothetical protein [Desulfosarcina ovata]